MRRLSALILALALLAVGCGSDDADAPFENSPRLTRLSIAWDASEAATVTTLSVSRGEYPSQ